MRPWEYWRMTPEELGAVVHGYMRRQAKEYERFAWALAMYYNWNRSKGRPSMAPHKLLPSHILRLLGHQDTGASTKDDE